MKEFISKVLRIFRIYYINYGYRHNCSRMYWIIYLLLNFPFCSVYHDVLYGDDLWMINVDRHFMNKLNQFQSGIFNKIYNGRQVV